MRISRQVSLVPPLGLIALLSAGCVAYEPKPLVPTEELEALCGRNLEGFVVERSEMRPAAAAPTPFDVADGLDEAELVSIALVLNPVLRAKRLEVGEGRALLLSAGIWPNPEFALGVRPGLGGAAGYTVDTELLFALLRGGERETRQGVAVSNLERLRADIAAFEWRTVADVRQRHLAVLARERTSALLDEELALRERILGLSRRRQEIGEGTELDVMLAELEVAEIRRDGRKALFELENARRELNQALGLPPAFGLTLSATGKPLRFLVYTDVAPSEIDRRLLAGRFELRAAEAAYAKAENELKLAVDGQYPRFSLGPAYGREPEGSHYAGIGLSVELPLFDRNQGEIAAAEARREQFRAEYVALLQQLRAAAQQALASVGRARREVEAQERELLPLVERGRDLFERAFQSRDIRAFEWFTVQQRVLRVRQSYLDALVAYQSAVLELEASTGLALSAPAPDTRPEIP